MTNVDTRTYCATNSFLLYLAVPTTGTDNRHANCQASATTCAVCSVSTNCATFFYAANIASATLEAATGYVFATKTAAEAQCKTCIGSKLVQISATG